MRRVAATVVATGLLTIAASPAIRARMQAPVQTPVGADYVAGNYLVRKAVRAESDALGMNNIPAYDVRVYGLR